MTPRFTPQHKTETKAIFERKSNTHLKLTSKKSLKNCFATFFKNKNKLKSCCWDENCHFSFEFPQHPNRLSLHFFMVSTCYLFLRLSTRMDITIVAESRAKGIKIIAVFPVYELNHLCVNLFLFVQLNLTKFSVI